MQLRPYQEANVNSIRASFRAGKRAPLYVLPTGGGKTVVFAHITAASAGKGNRVMVLVHRVELLRQTSAALYKSGVPHGLINPNFTQDLMAKVQVASVQTLVRRLDKITPPEFLIIDEAHHAVASTWAKIIAAWPNTRILGVTATPIRMGGKGLGKQVGGHFDDIIIGPQVDELIRQGFLVKPIIYAPRTKLNLTSLKVTAGDYDKAELVAAVDTKEITGDAVEHYKRICPGVPAVAFCVNIMHAQHVAEEFRRAGFTASHVDGTMDDFDRVRILNGLGDGSIQVVTSCDLISEGTDIPAIECAILLRPTQSTGLHIQQVGRALRVANGKTHAIILDHAGNTLLHGLPDEPREWTLDGEPPRKKKRKADKAPRVKQCDKCYAIHAPAPVCPVCGFKYVGVDKMPDVVEGELVAVTDADREYMKQQRRRTVGSLRTLEELEAFGRAKGYKDGWAKHVWASRQKKELQL